MLIPEASKPNPMINDESDEAERLRFWMGMTRTSGKIFFCLVSVRDDVLKSIFLWDLGVGFCCFFESVDLGWVILSFYHGLKVTMEVLSRREVASPSKSLNPNSF